MKFCVIKDKSHCPPPDPEVMFHADCFPMLHALCSLNATKCYELNVWHPVMASDRDDQYLCV